jgi:hypothetical protein
MWKTHDIFFFFFLKKKKKNFIIGSLKPTYGSYKFNIRFKKKKKDLHATSLTLIQHFFKPTINCIYFLTCRFYVSNGWFFYFLFFKKNVIRVEEIAFLLKKMSLEMERKRKKNSISLKRIHISHMLRIHVNFKSWFVEHACPIVGEENYQQVEAVVFSSFNYCGVNKWCIFLT